MISIDPHYFPNPPVEGLTLPEAYYLKFKKNPEQSLFFNKRDGKWISATYREGFDFICRTIAGLQALGFKRGDKAAIFAENRNEWIITDYAAQWLGGATAAIYVTNTAEQVKYILNESEATVMFTSGQNLLRKLDGMKGLESLKTIVAWDQVAPIQLASDIKILQRNDFLKPAIDESQATELLKVLTPEDTCILLYTSGTTGEPKGVILTHRNLVFDVNAMAVAFPIVCEGKCTVSFLPLSHIYERALHNLMVLVGLQVYFAESMDKLIDNIMEVRPQVLVSVPRIFEKMYTRIFEKMKNSSLIQKKIFFVALMIARKAFPFRYEHKPIPFFLNILFKIADVFVFKKIRAITGGRAEVFVSGGAPLSKEIAEFFFSAGFTILEGYGISETCILGCNRAEHLKFGTVGKPFVGEEFKIASDGEICVRGPTVMKGYYRRPDATAEAIDSDGFYHTGDIGEIDAEGFVKITDRKKDLIVTAGGKKVAPQPIENSLKKDPLIEGVCLLGDTKKYITALIVPSADLCRSWGVTKGIALSSLDDCAANERLKEHFQKEIDRVNAELPKYSTIKYFKVLPKPFAVENGELTPTLKLKRRVIQEHYAALIASMYDAEEGELDHLGKTATSTAKAR